MNGYLSVISILRDGTAGNLVGGSGYTTARVFPGNAQAEQPLPYISVDTYDTEPFDTKSGAATTDHDLVKVTIFSATDNECRQIASACRTDLDEHAAGTYNGFYIENIRFLRVDTYDLNTTNKRYRVHEQDYEVRIRV